jgi:hypothetical protein
MTPVGGYARSPEIRARFSEAATERYRREENLKASMKKKGKVNRKESMNERKKAKEDKQ